MFYFQLLDSVTGRVVPARIYTIRVHQTGNGALSMTKTARLQPTTAAAARSLVSTESKWKKKTLHFVFVLLIKDIK